MHPLYNLELEIVLPFLDPFLSCTRSCLHRNFGICEG